MEMRSYRKILGISYKDHVTNEEVCAKIQQAIEPHKDLTIVKRRKLQWYGHVSCSSGPAKTILQGTVKGGKKIRQTEEKVGRQHQGMDRPGVRHVPEGRCQTTVNKSAPIRYMIPINDIVHSPLQNCFCQFKQNQ